MNTNSIKPRAFKGLITTAAIATLVACGGGGGGGSSDEDAAIGSTEVLTQGAIQRFGSVYVNDIRYVRGANGVVKIDDNPSAGEDSLRIGMKVKLLGKRNDDGTGTYDSIEVDNELKGPIETGSIGIDPNNPKIGSFVVMGTTVLSRDGTYFDESGPGNTVNSLADLVDTANNEDVVAVSGMFNENGELEALRIEKKAENLAAYLADGRKLEVKGIVDTVNGGMQFTYESGLTVDFTTAEVDDDLPNDPGNWVGLYVESKCDPIVSVGSCFSGAILQATEIDNEAPEISDGYEAEFEGIISAFNGLDDFKVNYIPVDAADATPRFCDNVTLGDGVKVKVRGKAIDDAGVRKVDATSVECRQAKTVRLEGEVESEENGTITLLGVQVLTNNKTEKDDLASIEMLDTGDDIQVRGFVDGNGDVIAVRVEFEADGIDPDDFIVQAPKEQLADILEGSNTFKLLGVTIDTSALDGTLPDSDFEGVNDMDITRADFYDALENGTAAGVKAKGTYNPTTRTLLADEVELRQDDD